MDRPGSCSPRSMNPTPEPPDPTMAAAPADAAPVTIPDFARWKQQGRKISVLTAYDFTTARLLDAAGVDCLLVGDSLGTVVQGWETTLRVTLDQMVYHAEMVAAGRAAGAGGGRPAVRQLPGLARAGRAVGHAVPEGDAVPGGEARRGPAGRGDDPGAGRGRDPGDGARRSDPAVGPQARRLQGPARRRADRRRRPRRGRGRGVRRRARVRPRRARRPDHGRGCRSPPSASAPGRTATARCSSPTTCSACSRASGPEFVRRYAELADDSPRGRGAATSPTSRSGRFPNDQESFH